MSTTTVPAAPSREQSEAHVQRLIDLSIGRTYDAYEDVPWDDPAYAVDPHDPRLEPFSFDPIRSTDRFAQLDDDQRAQLGLERAAANMRIGWQFENLLQQGLLRDALRMRNDDRSFAYVHHEIVEESQHSMMFHEFCRRHVPHAHGMLGIDLFIGQRLVPFIARHAKALFWFFVLGGEIPVDVMQRRALRDDDTQLHPLLERIFTIHVEEEARHVSYAANELRHRVPRMGRVSRWWLGVTVPAVMAVMARMMVLPSLWLLRRWRVPFRDIRQAARQPQHRQLLRDAVARARSLCHELGLMSSTAVRVWKAGAIWEAPRT